MSADETMALRREVAELRQRVEAMEAASGLFVLETDLDTSKGDGTIRMDPRDWRGPSCKGRRMSECPPDFLDTYAKTLAYFADNPKQGKEKFSALDRLDAARCRTHARRIRGGLRPPAGGAPEFPGDQPSHDTSFEAPAFEAPIFEEPAFDDAGDDLF